LLQALSVGTSTRRLVILDGLDELPNAMDPREKQHNMVRLAHAARRADKVIVMVRTSYLRGVADLWELFSRKNDKGLWSQMAQFIPEDGSRPPVSAAILREFDTNQIHRFLERFAKARDDAPDWAQQFLESMNRNDPHGAYRTLSRNPLYLFLLAQTVPWANDSVCCFADVIELCINYWLHRDVEKGPSRWLLTTADRLDFIEAIAWWMFEANTNYLTFEEFDRIAKEFFSVSGVPLDRLKLDVQTTGVFACVGGMLYFLVPAYLDYFVAKHFHLRPTIRLPKDPHRLPTRKQALLWLGLAECTKQPWNIKYFTSIHELAKLYSFPINSDPIALAPDGIIYRSLPPDWRWPHLNADSCTPLRVFLNAALNGPEHLLNEKERIALLLICDARGLHARAASWLIQRFAKWMERFPSDKQPTVYLRVDHEVANPRSVMEVMLLCASRGTIVQLVYWGCTDEEIHSLLRSLGATPSVDRLGIWETHLNEMELLPSGAALLSHRHGA